MSRSEQAAQTVERPRMPEGYGVPTDADGLVPWSHAREQLAGAANYWIGTTRPDGRPHAAPIWGVVVDDTLYFGDNPQTRRGRNLAANPAVAVHIERGEEVVILEGTAEVAPPDAALGARIADTFAAKYDGFRPDPADWADGGLLRVRPRVALAWNTFPKSATRYRFATS